MKRLFAMLLLATACTTHTVPVYLLTQDSKPVVTDNAHTDAAMIEDAVARLGFGVNFVSEYRGALVVEVIEPKKGYPGRAYPSSNCLRIMRCDNIDRCAHEIGHRLGLGHVTDPANVMFHRVGKDNTKIEPWQRERMWSSLERLQRCHK